MDDAMTNEFILLAALALSPKLASQQPKPVVTQQQIVVTQQVWAPFRFTWSNPPSPQAPIVSNALYGTQSNWSLRTQFQATNRTVISNVPANTTAFYVTSIASHDTNESRSTNTIIYPGVSVPVTNGQTYFIQESTNTLQGWAPSTHFPGSYRHTNGADSTQFYLRAAWTNWTL